MLEPGDAELTIQQQANLLGVSRSSVYYHPTGPSAKEVAAKHLIDRIYTDYPFYGVRKITVEINKHFPISCPTVRRYLREMGLFAIYPGPNLSQKHPGHKVYPYLLRHLVIHRPNQVWGTDITYIPLGHGWMYLVAILDWFSRYVVAWELSDSLEIAFVLACVDQALNLAQPEILNSDQGSHFTSPQYTDRLHARNVQISMDSRGRALDNVFTERLWRSVKYEDIYIHEYQMPRELRLGLNQYFDFYNHRRPHQALGYMTPAQVHFQRPTP